MFKEKRLEARVDVPSTRWHNLRGRFRSLFRPECVDNVEVWYNTLASRDSRDAFQRAMKSIQQYDCDLPQSAAAASPLRGSASSLPPIDANAVATHKAKHFARLYGAVLSAEGSERVTAWARSAPEPRLEDVRISFTAILATLNAKSVTKEHFVPKEISDEDRNSKEWHRKRIDWMSKKVHTHMQNTVKNPMGGIEANPMLDQRALGKSTVRFTKPKSQFDGDAVLKSLGLDSEEALSKLRERREMTSNATLSTIDDQGCHVYQRSSKVDNSVQASSRNRIVATFNNNDTSGWQTTTRETIRDHSGSALAKATIVSSDNHPSMTRVTASLGMVLPHPSLAPK